MALLKFNCPRDGGFDRVTVSLGMDGWKQGMEKRMGIPQELLEILVCPICKTPVKLTPDNLGLKCETCRRVYPVRDDIPVMLPEEAKIEEPK
jgi:uncharacterized protein YbaR (Trm112 family)